MFPKFWGTTKLILDGEIVLISKMDYELAACGIFWSIYFSDSMIIPLKSNMSSEYEANILTKGY